VSGWLQELMVFFGGFFLLLILRVNLGGFFSTRVERLRVLPSLSLWRVTYLFFLCFVLCPKARGSFLIYAVVLWMEDELVSSEQKR